MSGGGGDPIDWRPVRGQDVGANGEDRCDIVERTVLNSPVAQVVQTLNQGAVLSVHYADGPRPRLEVRDENDRTAGAITSPRLVDLIECIQLGNNYEATVIGLDGGRIEIEIRRK